MARILFLLFIAFLIYLLWRGFTRGKKEDETPPSAATRPAEDMVQCSRCGVNLPRSEALLEAGKITCLNNPQCRP